MPKTDRKTPAKRGRPPLPPGEGKRHPLNMRTTKALRDRLEAASKESGRSLVQEVEFRVEQSFERTDFGLEALGLGGPDNHTFVTLVGLMFKKICEITGAQSVWTDPQAFVEAEAGIYEFFKAIRKRKPSLVKNVEAYDLKAGLGRGFGKGAGGTFVGTFGAEERVAAYLRGMRGAPRPEGEDGPVGTAEKLDKGRKS